MATRLIMRRMVMGGSWSWSDEDQHLLEWSTMSPRTFTIAIGANAIFLIIVRVAGHPLIGLDLLDMLGEILAGRRAARAVLPLYDRHVDRWDHDQGKMKRRAVKGGEEEVCSGRKDLENCYLGFPGA